MSKILAIGTALPAYRHAQEDIRQFMERVYAPDATDARKLKFLYRQSGIDSRYSVIPDYSRPASEWVFYPAAESLEPFPSLEKRMQVFQQQALPLSIKAIESCFSSGSCELKEVTHLITVTCTGLSAPGLDLQLMESLDLPAHLQRSSINFMGCYAAIHGLKQANQICAAYPDAKVLLVCTELCTLHFQKEPTADNLAASMLFGDGAAAVLLGGDSTEGGLAHIRDFYAEVSLKGKQAMSWELSSTGFQMTLSGYVPELLSTDFFPLIQRAFSHFRIAESQIAGWCIHPGGKRILSVIQQSLSLEEGSLDASAQVLKDYGNMSSPTVLFVLNNMLTHGVSGSLLAAAFGPGLTMETCLLETI